MIAEYSKGMRKRVAMAASLIHKPELFLMDEPFEGVDAVGARLMKDILLDQVRHGATIFLTSHVLEVVERLCDHAAIINDGKIVAEGSMDELRAGLANAGRSFRPHGGRGPRIRKARMARLKLLAGAARSACFALSAPDATDQARTSMPARLRAVSSAPPCSSR